MEKTEDSWSYRQIYNKKGIEIIENDVRNLDVWRKLISKHNVIYHFAAETGTGQSMYQISNYSDVNIIGTSQVFQALSENQNHTVKKIIYASSRSIYGEENMLIIKALFFILNIEKKIKG